MVERPVDAVGPDKKAKTVLMVDHFFPPMGEAGARRTLGFVGCLTRFGWHPIVLTVRAQGNGRLVDPSLLSLVPPSVDVQRTNWLDPVDFVRNVLSKNRREPTYGNSASHASLGPSWRRLSWARALERWFLFPDRQIGWFPFAVARGLSVCRNCAVDVIYSTSTAITSHLVAYILKKFLGKPWLADFQDPWAENVLGFPSSVHQRLADRLEGLIIRAADRVTFVTDPVRKAFQKKYVGFRPEKFEVIPMGYNPDNFDGVPVMTRPKFTITHFGTFYGPRSPRPFLEALGGCIRQHPELDGNLDVRFFGNFDPELHALTVGLIDREKLGEIVHLEGVVPYTAGLQWLMSSDVLLLVTDSGLWGRSLIPSKLFEYLATTRPILALAPEGPTGDIVRAAGAGVIVPPDDVRAISDAIWTLYQRATQNCLRFPIDHEIIRRFRWSELTERLVTVFEEMLATNTFSNTATDLIPRHKMI